MITTIENEPHDGNQYTVGRIINYLYHQQSTVDEKLDFLNRKFGDNFFFYKGGSHIAIHERSADGTPDEKRLIFVEL